MDDKYFLTEHQVMILNDDHVKKEEKTKCEFTINYKKPILLNRRMECALIKLHVPSQLFAKKSNIFELKLHLRFMNVDPEITVFLRESSDFDGETYKTIDYSFPAIEYSKEEITEKLYKINLDMIEQMKKFWNSPGWRLGSRRSPGSTH